MNRRLPLAFFLTLLAIILAIATAAEPQSLQYQHGHLLNIPVLFDEDFLPLWSKEYAFLAVKLESVPEKPACVDYQQTVDWADLGGGWLVRDITISRCVSTSQVGADNWLLLPLVKPCAPGETSSDVGHVTVCPPRQDGQSVDLCAFGGSGITPLYQGVPPEHVPCGTKKRRSVR